jgi:hypothetical protein
MNDYISNHYIDISQIYIPKYIYMDELYDYDEILLNISRKKEQELGKRKRSIGEEENEE